MIRLPQRSLSSQSLGKYWQREWKDCRGKPAGWTIGFTREPVSLSSSSRTQHGQSEADQRFVCTDKSTDSVTHSWLVGHSKNGRHSCLKHRLTIFFSSKDFDVDFLPWLWHYKRVMRDKCRNGNWFSALGKKSIRLSVGAGNYFTPDGWVR